jgi:hypothetical protein
MIFMGPLLSPVDADFSIITLFAANSRHSCCALACVFLAAGVALRSDLLSALRNE